MDCRGARRGPDRRRITARNARAPSHPARGEVVPEGIRQPQPGRSTGPGGLSPAVLELAPVVSPLPPTPLVPLLLPAPLLALLPPPPLVVLVPPAPPSDPASRAGVHVPPWQVPKPPVATSQTPVKWH